MCLTYLKRVSYMENRQMSGFRSSLTPAQLGFPFTIYSSNVAVTTLDDFDRCLPVLYFNQYIRCLPCLSTSINMCSIFRSMRIQCAYRHIKAGALGNQSMFQTIQTYVSVPIHTYTYIHTYRYTFIRVRACIRHCTEYRALLCPYLRRM